MKDCYNIYKNLIFSKSNSFTLNFFYQKDEWIIDY